MKFHRGLLTVATAATIITFALFAREAADAQVRRRRAPAGPGVVSRVKWSEDGRTLSFTSEEKRYRVDLHTLQKVLVPEGEDDEGGEAGARRNARRQRRGGRSTTGTYIGRPARGRQYTQVDSPNGRWEAHYRNYNVVLVEKETKRTVSVTIDGDESIHYGTASWVYGEELGQRKAMWWTPDSQKLLFYRFDDSAVKPFHLVTGWSKINTVLYDEYYPKAGAQNPAAELLIYDLASQKITHVDLGGSPEEYIYNIRTSPDGAVFLVNWTDRLQHDLKVYAIDLESGAVRLVVEEHQETWQENSPRMRYLKDKRRFLWPTDESGYTHYELRDLDGQLHATVIRGEFQTAGIQFVDEERDLIGFTAYSSSANPYYLQYHLVHLDGSDQRRVTSTDRHHSNFHVSLDREWLVAQFEEVNTPPCTALYRADGSLALLLAESDPGSAANLAEMFHFRSNDDRFDIYGVLYKPEDFDPTRRYPVINALYGGPGSHEISARYVSRPRAECRRGYLVVKVNNRGTGSRGKALLGATYLRLGDVDIQDHADAIRLLRERPYFDGARVGIVGHSYGGYMAAMGIFKHPDVYAAAVDRAGPTDWRNYDTIYTERYMSTPQLNPEGYDIGRPYQPEYIERFKELGRHLLIMHGMVDDNVHPNNAFQLIRALDEADVPYESRFFPDGAHGLGRGSGRTQWEFFDRILKPQLPTPGVEL